MKGRVIAVTHDPCHAALIVDGRVEDLMLTASDNMPMVGEIRPAEVTRKLTGDSAVFVSLGGGIQGYLRDGKGLRAGDSLPVMVTGLPEPGKAVPVSRRLLIKGRGLILTPGAPGVNVSRQIRDPDERARLADVVTAPGAEVGVIIRSAAQGLSNETLSAECQDLAKFLPGARDQVPSAAFEGLAAPAEYAFREWTTPLPDMIAVPESLDARLDWDQDASPFHHDPDLADTLRLGDGDPFDHFGVWDEIERLKSTRADLPSGGWIAVETTRAMVTVDVNTGDGFGGGDMMTANVEAARELPRQLRLRGLGGQITIDFAPLKKAHRKKIEEELKRAFRRCPVETSLAGWTPLGNLELTRKRERRPLTEVLPD